MWKKPANPVVIESVQVVKGLYVWINLNWSEHPFVSDRFLVRTDRDVALIQTLDLAGRLFYYPELSSASPLPLGAAQAVDPGAGSAARVALAQEAHAVEEDKRLKLRAQKAAAARAERAWEDAASATRKALQGLARSPKAAGEELVKLSYQIAATIAHGNRVLLHLLGDRKGQGPQFHALNTMTLSMLLGKVVGLPEWELADLAMAALAHDAGKAQVPGHILKTLRRKKFEEDFYRQHVAFSVQLATQSGAFSKEALVIIGDHHEAVDGSGWPQGKKNAGRGARILAVVDRYDELCTPEASDCPALMPAEVLSHMYRHEAARFDPALLGALIKLLGVYPPGTLVELSNDTLALVVSPGPDSLQPKVLVYSPETSKEEAPILELAQEPTLKITRAVRPDSLPPEVLEWINPQHRLAYFFSVAADPA